MNHAELIKIAKRQLEKWRCCPVISELVTLNSTGEIPDAVGWTHRASILFECKASRVDFLADKKKPFRQVENGIGDFRFYLIDNRVKIQENEIPDGWGLLYRGQQRQNQTLVWR